MTLIWLAILHGFCGHFVCSIQLPLDETPPMLIAPKQTEKGRNLEQAVLKACHFGGGMTHIISCCWLGVACRRAKPRDPTHSFVIISISTNKREKEISKRRKLQGVGSLGWWGTITGCWSREKAEVVGGAPPSLRVQDKSSKRRPQQWW